MVKIFIALDSSDINAISSFVKASFHSQEVADIFGLKFGLEFFVAHGFNGITTVLKNCKYQPEIFLDLKFFDIPNTMLGALKSCIASGLNIKITTIHALSGLAAMTSISDFVRNNSSIMLFGVTVLTSFDQVGLSETGITKEINDQVLNLCNLCQMSQVHGVVCSPLEVKVIKNHYPNLQILTPGIRQKADSGDDQKRTMDISQAFSAGSNFLVIGRPITAATDPVQEIHSILYKHFR